MTRHCGCRLTNDREAPTEFVRVTVCFAAEGAHQEKTVLAALPETGGVRKLWLPARGPVETEGARFWRSCSTYEVAV